MQEMSAETNKYNLRVLGNSLEDGDPESLIVRR